MTQRKSQEKIWLHKVLRAISTMAIFSCSLLTASQDGFMKRKRDPHGLIFFLYYSSSLWCYRCFQINKSSNEKPKHKQECNPKKELGQKLFIFSLWRSSRCWNTKQHLKVLKKILNISNYTEDQKKEMACVSLGRKVVCEKFIPTDNNKGDFQNNFCDTETQNWS